MARPLFFRAVLLGSFLILLGFVPSLVMAHGTDIRLSVLNNDQIGVQADFDTGEPMSEAQILVYAADNPREAWHSGEADSNGAYVFDVDTSIAGDWAISVRTAGHGEILHFTVSERGTIQVEQTNERPFWLTTLLSMAVVAVLGAVAWYYSRPKPKVA